jgi:hypothetical protein
MLDWHWRATRIHGCDGAIAAIACRAKAVAIGRLVNSSDEALSGGKTNRAMQYSLRQLMIATAVFGVAAWSIALGIARARHNIEANKVRTPHDWWHRCVLST